MSDLAIARRYARALADAVAESKDQELVRSELEEFAALFRAEKMLRAYLLDVRAKAELRERVVNTVSEKGKFSPWTRNVLVLVARHGRFGHLGEIVRLYGEELDRRHGVVRASVSASVPLNDEQTGRLAQTLSRVTGRRAELDIRVDEDLLAGAVVRIGSRVYDASLRTQIARLAERMTA